MINTKAIPFIAGMEYSAWLLYLLAWAPEAGFRSMRGILGLDRQII